MKDILTRISKARFPYEPLIEIEISRPNLLHNLHEFEKLAPKGGIAPVLKSNAYGHGFVDIARALERPETRFGHAPHLPFFVVDSYFEAIALRANHVKTPILVIGYTHPRTIFRARLKKTSFTITSLESLRELSKIDSSDWAEEFTGGMIGFNIPLFPHPNRIHLKIDTGMRRQGILMEEIPEAIDIIKNSRAISLEGVCSHLSNADCPNESDTEEQIILWNRAVKQFRTAFPTIKYFHLSNTDGHKFTSDISANVSRLGLGLYGLIDGGSFKPELDLKPILKMKTILTGVKKLKTGESVGYGNTFTAVKDMTIATIPVGYYECLDRRFSSPSIVSNSRGHQPIKTESLRLLVGPKKIPCPTIGRVSMNISTLDVSGIREPKIGMEVVVISDNPDDPNSVSSMARLAGTIPYEITVKIPAHLKRMVVG